jgi:hydrogenase nickel incorporation protein HypA/HybF
MHEFALAQSLLSQVRALAAEHDAKRVRRIRVAVGSMAGVVVDSFRFGFEVLAADTALTRDAGLEIETALPSYTCLACGHAHGRCEARPASCNRCGGRDLVPRGGDEILLLQIEME